jgi:hypothetical protein
MEIEKENKLQHSVVLTDKFIIESSHEVKVAEPYLGDKVWIEDDKYVPQEINEYEKELLKGTKNVNELLEEEKKDREKQERELTDLEKEYNIKREIITKVKVIALDKMDKHPLQNPSLFSRRDKSKLIEHMEEVLKLPHEELNNKFNRICNEVLFAPEVDLTKFSVYKS